MAASASEPFKWDPDRRLQLRCEIDAALFHLFLPSTSSGEWLRTPGESTSQLEILEKHFPKPRDAASYMIDQFHIQRESELRAPPDGFGRYRTKDRVLEIYDQMMMSASMQIWREDGASV